MQVLQILAPVLCLAAMVLNLWSFKKSQELRQLYILRLDECRLSIDRAEAIVLSYGEDIEAGRLWRTPFGVGADVYFILPDSTIDGGLYVSDPHHVSEVCTRGFWTSAFPDKPDGIDDFTPWSEYGVTAFLIREDAEAELLERRKNG